MLQFHLPSLKTSLLTIGILTIPLFTYLIWTATTSPATLSKATDPASEAGKLVREDFQLLPALAFSETDTTYTVEDTATDGIQITFANTETKTEEKPKLNLSFPKDYAEPIEVKLDEKRTIKITDLSGKNGYTSEPLQTDALPREEQGFFARLFDTEAKDAPKQYLRYTSQDERKSLLYAFQKDQATGEKKLKHWTLYQEGTGLETEEYRIENAKVRINEGKAEVFYYGEQDLKNDQAVAEVDQNLLERAQRTLAKEMGDDLLSGTHTPDFTIPEPYYLDRNGEKHAAEWKWDDEASTLSVTLTPDQSLYPIALDPTLSFTAPGVSNGGSVISGERAGTTLGYSFAAGDFNADGKIDLVVGGTGGGAAYGGAVYIFYSDGAIADTSDQADVMIYSSTASDNFGWSLTTGDFNADGRIDLATGSYYRHKIWILYNDGSWPATAQVADVIINGEASSYFGQKIVSADFNTDGKTDLAVGADIYSTNTGRAYVFYADGTNNYGTASCTGSSPTTCLASDADVIITGETTSNYFGAALGTGDFNADGKTDLIVGAYGYSSNTGRAYIFYNGAIVTEGAGSADVLITGETTSNYFGTAFASGDFNTDGEIDIAVGAVQHSSFTGRVYIFQGDGTNNYGTAVCSGTPASCSAGNADTIISGEAGVYGLGTSLTTGDLNSDGRIDLVAGASWYTTDIGRTYVLYNDGSYPTTTATADVIIAGQATSNLFGKAAITGDFNADGKTDLAVGAGSYASFTGRVYLFYSQNGQVNTNQSIAGETTSNDFGSALVTGDFNADGRTDLVVGANAYSGGTGRAYVFYGDGQIPSSAGTADAVITGETASDSFGYVLVAGDLNADGKTDLVVTAPGYAVNDLGRTYVFYNGSIATENASGADAIITGAAGYIGLGVSAVTGDLNADGKTDLAVYGNYFEGYVYIFYGGSIITETTSGADIVINGDVSGLEFGNKMTVGDFNVDGKTDLAVLGPGYSSRTGRVYIFYGGSIITETGSGADIIITGAFASAYMNALVSGDFNADGRIDLAVGAYGTPGGSYSGYLYIFYGGSIITETTSGADVTMTGPGGSAFGQTVIAGDFNADGRTDLAAGGRYYGSDTGRVYVFYNDGSLPTTADTADLMITGETTSNYFSFAMAAGDMNGDGRTDLIVGAYGNTTNTGKVYFYETRENFAWQIQRRFATTGGTRTGLAGTGQEIQITGETGSGFGVAVTTGDFNNDGKQDFAVGASVYSSDTGRVYVFYGDGQISSTAVTADVTITGDATLNYFGASLASGDFNADGRTDLAVSAFGYSTSTGRTYIFYNDGSMPITAATADITITGGATINYFGASLASGDFNADGRTDLAVSAYLYSSNTGRTYIFHNDGSIPTTAGTADVTITGGTANDFFGSTLAAGDFNADGRTDLAVGAFGYSSYTGRTYIFHNDGSIPTTAGTADVTITGGGSSNLFGASLASGDFNADGRTDLAVGASGYSGSTGRAYIFHNDGSIPTTAGTADIIITGESISNNFGHTITSGDLNADGRTDLAVSAYGYSTSTGRAYIFHNDGSIPTTAATADVTITGEATGDSLGASLASVDFNADGKTDLIVGAYTYSSNKGRIYAYTFNDPVITGGATGDQFGWSLASGDFNADGRTDLAVGANSYSTNTGRVYVFYNDGIIPSAVASADAVITGESTGQYFGQALATGDFNADGKIDLVASAPRYPTNAGRIYFFYNGSITTENASGADYFITGNRSGWIGSALATGDLNADGKTDLVATLNFSGEVAVFYNDGSIPTNDSSADFLNSFENVPDSLATGDFNADGRIDFAVGDTWTPGGTGAGSVNIYYNDGSYSTPDVTITGESAGDVFGTSLVSGDWNTDGRTDLAVGAQGYSSSTGRAYVFYNDGSLPTTAATADVIITGEAVVNNLGFALASGDLNADGRTDLIVGAQQYNGSNNGRAYIFYGGSIMTENASGADSIMTGATGNGFFGHAFAVGDFNTDGKSDLAVGAYFYSSQTGRVYIFTSEVSTPEAVQDVSAKTRGIIKARGNIKIR